MDPLDKLRVLAQGRTARRRDFWAVTHALKQAEHYLKSNRSEEDPSEGSVSVDVTFEWPSIESAIKFLVDNRWAEARDIEDDHDLITIFEREMSEITRGVRPGQRFYRLLADASVRHGVFVTVTVEGTSGLNI